MKQHILEKKTKPYRILFFLPVLYFCFSLILNTEDTFVVCFGILCALCCLIISYRYITVRRIALHGGGILKIYGLLSSLSLPSEEVSYIEVKKDFLCYVFDLRKITINNKNLYTVDFDIIEFKQFISTEFGSNVFLGR